MFSQNTFPKKLNSFKVLLTRRFEHLSQFLITPEVISTAGCLKKWQKFAADESDLHGRYISET